MNQPGLIRGKDENPICKDIIELMSKHLGYPKKEMERRVREYKHDEHTTIYYLLLKDALAKSGEKYYLLQSP